MIYYYFTRHVQRYEYVVAMGYVKNKNVIDIGAGSGYGSAIMSMEAKMVLALDPNTKSFSKEQSKIAFPWSHPAIQPSKIFTIQHSLYDVDFKPQDVGVAIEVIEHNQSDEVFMERVSKVCRYLFITTPMVEKTGKTTNLYHLREYSHEDFVKVVGKKYNILDKAFQNNLAITSEMPEPRGDSMNPNHIVQMLWCKRKKATNHMARWMNKSWKP